jgi:hypothetical protein
VSNINLIRIIYVLGIGSILYFIILTAIGYAGDRHLKKRRKESVNDKKQKIIIFVIYLLLLIFELIMIGEM